MGISLSDIKTDKASHIASAYSKKITKSELKIRQKFALMEASGIDLTTREGRKDCFKRFADHNNQSMTAAKIRIIQKYAK